MDRITLKDILENKRKEIGQRRAQEPVSLLKEKIASLSPARDFKGALMKKKITAIAEIKKKSPSAGTITRLGVSAIAHEYEKSKYCSAVSVLTDKRYFGGDIKYLNLVKRITTKPILRKEFIIDAYQVYEARVYGADAILLIAGILPRDKLKELFELAGDLGLYSLIESHTVNDLKNIPPEAELYGINTRDLAGEFSTDLEIAKDLIRYIPPEKVIVVESGITTKRDIDFIKSLKRVNAVLIGTSILKNSHPGTALDALLE